MAKLPASSCKEVSSLLLDICVAMSAGLRRGWLCRSRVPSGGWVAGAARMTEAGRSFPQSSLLFLTPVDHP